MKTLWLIAARSGSKAIPHKNIRPLGHHPLLAYRAVSVLNFAPSKDLWISTDSEEYAKIAETYGAHIPFLRPAHLASDEASSIDVVLHAMQFAAETVGTYDAIALLEPTSPFIKSETLLAAEKLLTNTPEAAGIVACRYVHPNSFFIQEEKSYLDTLSERFAKSKGLRRQDFKNEITPSGGFYISRWNDFLKYKSFYTEKTLSYIVSDLEGLEIDSPLDWNWAEFLVQSELVKFKD